MTRIDFRRDRRQLSQSPLAFAGKPSEVVDIALQGGEPGLASQAPELEARVAREDLLRRREVFPGFARLPQLGVDPAAAELADTRNSQVTWLPAFTVANVVES